MLSAQRDLELCCENFRNESIFPSIQGAISNGGSEETCCLVTIVGFEYDVINLQMHPIYKPIDFKMYSTFNNSTSEEEYSNGSTEIDYSKYPFLNKIWLVKDDWEIVVKTLPLIPIVVMAILGNLAVICTVKRARLTKNIVNLFILNMSIADLLTALIFPWIFLIYDFYQKYVLGSFICKYEAFVLTSLMLCSVMSLTVISYDRLTAILFPFKSRMKPKSAKLIIYSIWCLSLAASSPLIIWRKYKERKWKDFLEQYCTEDPTPLQLFWLLIIVFLVWIPLAALIITYVLIVFKLDALEKRHKDHPIKQVKWKSRVVRMFFFVVVAFCLCWIPYTTFIFIRSQNALDANTVTKSFQMLFFISHYLLYVNCALNPIIYGLKNDNLKKEFRNALPRCLKRNSRIHISTVDGHGVTDRKGGQRVTGEMGDTSKGKNTQFRSGEKLTNWIKTAETYLDKSLFSGNGKEMASLSSYERRNSALEDLGLPVPKYEKYFEDDWSTTLQ